MSGQICPNGDVENGVPMVMFCIGQKEDVFPEERREEWERKKRLEQVKDTVEDHVLYHVTLSFPLKS